MTYKPPEISDEARKMAKKFFQHAVTVAETRNYDYAIELYLQGLVKDPLAVETGHKPLREVGLRRTLAGGKKAGLLETLKRASSKKDLDQALVNAEYLLAKDPLNANHCEALVKTFDKAELPEALGWGLTVLLELARQEKKISPQRLLLIVDLAERLGNHYDKSDQPDTAILYYQLAVNALDVGIQGRVTGDLDFVGRQRDLAGRLTILRGKYERAETFRESVRDADKQKEILDKERVVKSDELMHQLIAKARGELEANPDVAGKINGLCDLLLQRGKPEDEQEAINVLQRAHERTGQYAFRFRADDVRIRQLNRVVRGVKDRLAAAPDDADLQKQHDQAQKEVEDFELAVYQQRVREYPTDTRIKFELGRRLHRVKRYDEAIPVFQEALNDPRNAIRAKYYIGACFYQKGWHQQAINILTEAIERYDAAGDNLSKEMHYILGRSYENAGQKDQALKAYNKLIQWDFNYRDVRQHIDKLQSQT